MTAHSDQEPHGDGQAQTPDDANTRVPPGSSATTPTADDDKTRIAPGTFVESSEPQNADATRVAPGLENNSTKQADDKTRTAPGRPAHARLERGDVLRGRFVIERRLGQGGMGEVFLATDNEAEKSNPYVALKMLGEEFKKHPQSLKALRREASQSQRMNHPNIVNVFYFERTEEHVFMVMEYMQGRSLDVLLKSNPQGMALADALLIIDACCEGLKYIHKQKIIHSDFKPSNVFVTDDGEIKVLDLGIARSREEIQRPDNETKFDPVELGALTPRYASCEMLAGQAPTEQDDLYALACVAYELLTGTHPYGCMNAQKARAAKLEPNRPKVLKKHQWRALKSALAFTRSERPMSIDAFQSKFTSGRTNRETVAWIAAASAAVAIVITIAGSLYLRFTDADERFIATTLAQYANGGEIAATAKAKEWLEQGDFFFNMGQRSLQSGDYDKGISHLLTAPNSAFQAFRLVLNRSNDEPSRQTAARGILGIVTAFKQMSLTLGSIEQSSKDNTAKLTCAALELKPRDGQMLELLARLDQTLPGGVEALDACRRIIKSGKVSL